MTIERRFDKLSVTRVVVGGQVVSGQWIVNSRKWGVFSGINSLKWHKMKHLNANGTSIFFGSKSWFSFEIEIMAPGLQFIVSLIN